MNTDLPTGPLEAALRARRDGGGKCLVPYLTGNGQLLAALQHDVIEPEAAIHIRDHGAIAVKGDGDTPQIGFTGIRAIQHPAFQ